MSGKGLVPTAHRGRKHMPVRHGGRETFRDFQRDMNRLFNDSFTGGALLPRMGGADLAGVAFNPHVDVSETEEEVKISARLPGINEKDITVEMDEAAVAISGEKKRDHEEKGRDWYRREQSYGSFCRLVPLPAAVDGAKAKARFKEGVLTVTVPKTGGGRGKRKTVTVEAE
ncbi:MAG: Hsp20/alpha crystallin family protein [bacterium]